jgi:hypothetical protein
VKKTPQPKTRIFNLLKPTIEPPTAWDKIYMWIVGKARVVMVIAEVVVAITFVAKVVVDIQAKNLDEQINKREAELSLYAKQVEPEIRKLQQKAITYEKVWKRSSDYAPILEEIDSYISVTEKSIAVRFSGENVSVRGGGNLEVLKEIESNMRGSSTFSNVQLSVDTESGAIQEGTYLITATIATDYTRGDMTDGQ